MTKISIHAPREGGDDISLNPKRFRYISIHAPREGGDVAAHDLGGVVIISIHAPREGGDISVAAQLWAVVVAFQSTPPARGATAKMHSFTCGSLTNK